MTKCKNKSPMKDHSEMVDDLIVDFLRERIDPTKPPPTDFEITAYLNSVLDVGISRQAVSARIRRMIARGDRVRSERYGFLANRRRLGVAPDYVMSDWSAKTGNKTRERNRKGAPRRGPLGSSKLIINSEGLNLRDHSFDELRFTKFEEKLRSKGISYG